MSVTGIVLLFLAGFAQGTFGIGMKRISPLSWESFWLVYSVVGMLLIPLVWGIIATPCFFEAIFQTDISCLISSFILGFLWGIGGILFGVGVNYVGVSITNGVVMGLAGGLGAIIPLFGIDGVTKQPSFIYVIIGVIAMLVGVFFSAYSGILRDRKRSENVSKQSKSFKGLFIVVLAGILSSLLNIGFEEATPIVVAAKNMGAPDEAASIPARAFVVLGGLFMNAGYAIFLLIRNSSWRDFNSISVNKGSYRSIFMAAFTGLLWFLPLGLSGIVAVSIGELGNVITWPVMLSLSLIFGNIWGYFTGEWKDSKKAFSVMILSSVILIVACLILTFKDYLS